MLLPYVAALTSCRACRLSQGVLAEDSLFEWLERLGLKRDDHLPQPADGEKVEALVKTRLVAEAYLRRQKKKNEPDTYEYVPGIRAGFNRNQANADAFRATVLGK